MRRRFVLWTAATLIAMPPATFGVILYARKPDVGTYWLDVVLLVPLVGLVLYGLHRVLPVRLQWVAAVLLAPFGPIAYVVWPNDQWWNYGALTVVPLLLLAWEAQDRRAAERGEEPEPSYGGWADGPWAPP
jgi:hypothetical protein